MKPSALLPLLVIPFMLLTGCAGSGVPTPNAGTTAHQLSVKTAAQWQYAAKDMAEKFKEAVKKHKLEDVPVKLDNKKHEKEMGTDFQRAFQDLLITELVNEEIDVLIDSDRSDAKAMDLEYEIQMVKHSPAYLSAEIPRREIIVNASLSLDNLYLARSSGVYYVSTDSHYSKKRSRDPSWYQLDKMIMVKDR